MKKNKEKISENKKNYGKKNKIKIAARRKKYREDNIEKIKEDLKQYNKNNRDKINLHYRNKYATDEKFRNIVKLRRRLIEAFKLYSKNGKVQTSKKYGIDWQKIFEHLGPCPGSKEDYQIDHIFPLVAFNFDDLVQVKAAFAPENHQWLKIEENLSKNDTYDPIALQNYLQKFSNGD